MDPSDWIRRRFDESLAAIPQEPDRNEYRDRSRVTIWNEEPIFELAEIGRLLDEQKDEDGQGGGAKR